jgi:hypothetical protein
MSETTDTTAIVPKPTRRDIVAQVTTWILAGGTEHQISQAIAKAFPSKAARPLIVAAMADIARAADGDPDLVVAWAIEATRAIFAEAKRAGDYSAALRAIKQIVELREAM